MRMKRLALKADHSPQSDTEVKNGWSFISSPLYAFMACTWTVLPLFLSMVYQSFLKREYLFSWSVLPSSYGTQSFSTMPKRTRDLSLS